MYTKNNPIPENEKEELAKKIRMLLLKNEMWSDVKIYFNGKSFSTYDPETNKYYYNDSNKFITIEDEDPCDYFEYANPDTISMSFEGPFYDAINYDTCESVLEEFNKLLESYGLYYELGNAWNLSCYYAM